mmetsp:Transcript_61310/g.145999  ORF Transcript_61310/g.145999 Transcript_61310/m.145999 type:complete len:247 (+) Transcript_61310:318-1058(+)
MNPLYQTLPYPPWANRGLFRSPPLGPLGAGNLAFLGLSLRSPLELLVFGLGRVQSTLTVRSPNVSPVIAIARFTASLVLSPRNSTKANPLGASFEAALFGSSPLLKSRRFAFLGSRGAAVLFRTLPRMCTRSIRPHPPKKPAMSFSVAVYGRFLTRTILHSSGTGFPWFRSFAGFFSARVPRAILTVGIVPRIFRVSGGSLFALRSAVFVAKRTRATSPLRDAKMVTCVTLPHPTNSTLTCAPLVP